jgi:hypothetical protein
MLKSEGKDIDKKKKKKKKRMICEIKNEKLMNDG